MSSKKHAFLDIIHDSGVENLKICVVSIAGPYRKGKSFMNNIFVEYLEKSVTGAKNGSWCNRSMKLDKFHWRGGKEPDTTGIYLWSKPFIRKDKNGDEVAVFLMDSQGTFDSRSTVRQCATIFALATMLSSINIINVSMNIQEDDLLNLALFTEYAKVARTNCKEKPFERILFLVRDWQNSEECAYGFEGGQEFLKSIMKQTPEQDRELKELRANLESSFQQMDCFLMPHPGLKIANNNKNTCIGDAEEDFLKFAGEFVEKTVDKSSLQAKTIAGKKVTCKQIAQFFERFTDLFNSDETPAPKSILQATAEIAMLHAFTECISDYQKILNAFMNCSEPDVAKLALVHDTAKNAALAKYDNARKFGGNSSSDDKHIVNLEKHIIDFYVNIKQRVTEIENCATERKQRLFLEEKSRIENEQQKKQNELINKEFEVKIALLERGLKHNKEKNGAEEVLQTIQKVAETVAPIVYPIIYSLSRH